MSRLAVINRTTDDKRVRTKPLARRMLPRARVRVRGDRQTRKA